MKFIRVKRIVLVMVILSLLSPIFSFPGASPKVSARVNSCNLDLKSLSSDERWILYLEQSYEQSMRFANDPFHHEYHEDHLDNAQDTLKLIVSAMSNVANLLGKLSNCSGLGNYSFDEVVDMMRGILLRFTSSFYDRDLGLERFGFNEQYRRMILNLRNLEEHEDFKDLYRTVVLMDEQINAKTERIMNNWWDGYADRSLFRALSLDKDSATISNLAIMVDGLALLKSRADDVKKDIEELSKDPMYNQDQKKKLKEVAGRNFGRITLDNLKSMGLRALYKSAIEQSALQPNMEPSHRLFIEDLSGNLASVMVSTDYLSFMAAYTEFVGDMYDYINDKLVEVSEMVDSSLAEFHRVNDDVLKHQELFDSANSYVIETTKLKTDSSLTVDQYVKKFDQIHLRFVNEVEKIYKLDKSTIKIYLNGKRLTIPEKVYAENGATMVPLRVISEELGVKPVYNPSDKTITITTTKNMLSMGKPMDVIMTIGSKNVQVGRYFESLLVAPTVKNGVTFVPLSFIAQNLGLKVEWIASSNSVVLTSRNR